MFATLFSVAQGAPAFGDLNSESFYELAKSMNRRSLGESTLGETDDAGKSEGYLFSAYERRTVKDVLAKL